MQHERVSQSQYVTGIGISLLGHLLFAAIAVLILEKNAASVIRPNEVFSVTLEGGELLGGISQVPKEGAKKVLTQAADEDPGDQATPPDKSAPPEKVDDPKPVKETPEQIALKVPSVVDDPAKALAEKKLEEEKLRKKEEEKKKLEEDKKRKEEERKKKAEDEKKRQEEAKKDEEEKKKDEEKRKKEERAQRDRQLADTLRKLKQRYEGESADAGGKGFGAAALGGKGMGGGTLASAQKIAYQNALQTHVKSGWRWLGGSDRLIARVQVKIQPDGRVQDVSIVQSSGNRNFDDSVVRAVFKASPVPPAPPELYPEFADVTFKFDSAE